MPDGRGREAGEHGPKTGTKRVPKQANSSSRNPIQFHEIPANLRVPNTPEATHNPKVAGSNPAPATTKGLEIETSERSGVFVFEVSGRLMSFDRECPGAVLA
jgi:hypothetical protein